MAMNLKNLVKIIITKTKIFIKLLGMITVTQPIMQTQIYKMVLVSKKMKLRSRMTKLMIF